MLKKPAVSFVLLFHVSLLSIPAQSAGLFTKLNQPKYDSCINLSCMSQAQYLEGTMTEQDYSSIKVKLSPYTSVRDLTSRKLPKSEQILDELSNKKLLEGISAGFLGVKQFEENQEIEDKILITRKIRGEEKINRFLDAVSGMSARLRDVEVLHDDGNRQLDSKGEKFLRGLGRFQNNYHTFFLAFMTALDMVGYTLHSLESGNAYTYIIPFFVWELSNIGLFGNHVAHTFYSAFHNHPRSWLEFRDRLTKKQHSESSENQYLFYSLNSRTVRALISTIKNSGEGSAALAPLLYKQAGQDRMVFPVGIMNLIRPKMSHMRTQLLFRKTPDGDQTLIITVTGQKSSPKTRPPSSQKKKDSEHSFQDGWLPEAG